MKLVYTGTQIRNAERPYLEAPDYDGYLMQRAADALAAERLLVKLAERFPEVATDAAALHTHQVQWSLDQARDFQDWLRTKPGKENEVIDGRWPIRR